MKQIVPLHAVSLSMRGSAAGALAARGTRRGYRRSGLGDGGGVSCCWLWSVSLYKGKKVWGHSPEAVSSHHL